MKKISIALIIAARSISAIAEPPAEPINPAAFSIDLARSEATKRQELERKISRAGVYNHMHKSCLNNALESDTSVSAANASCNKMMKAISTPLALTVVDMMWFRIIFDITSNPEAPPEAKEIALSALMEFALEASKTNRKQR